MATTLLRRASLQNAGAVRPDGKTIGIDALGVISVLPGANSTIPEFIDGETPAGVINGTNTAFTLANAPNPAGSLHLSWNGLRLSTADYSLTGNNLTLTLAPRVGHTLVASYRTPTPIVFVDGEIPTGPVNGANTVFNLANAPNPPSSLNVFWNGLTLFSPDYSLSGSTLTLTVPPRKGHNFFVDYRL